MNRFLYHVQVVGILVFLKDDMIFLSPFLDVIRVCKPTVIFELIKSTFLSDFVIFVIYFIVTLDPIVAAQPCNDFQF